MWCGTNAIRRWVAWGLGLWALNGAAEPVRLLDLAVQETPEQTQIVFDLSAPATHNVFTLDASGDKPQRVVVDLYDTRLAQALGQPPANHPLLRSIRSGIRNKVDLRVVFDLKTPVKFEGKLLRVKGGAGHRLVVNLASLRPLPASPPRPQNVPRAASRNPVAPPAAPLAGEQAFQAQNWPYSAPAPVLPPQVSNLSYLGREVIVAIDAGHGGVDPGALGPGGSREKDLTLLLAREFAGQVEREPGMRAVLIREGDSFLRLRERIERARALQADLFISIHADASENGKPMRGASVYMLSQRGASSEAARWLAEKENAADLQGGISLNDKDEVLASVLLDLSQTGTLEASAQLGGQVLRALGQTAPLHLQSVQQAAFMVLRSPDIPSILVETGFISNPAEEQKLNTPAYRTQLAHSLLEGLRAYLAKHAPPGTQLARQYGLLARQ